MSAPNFKKIFDYTDDEISTAISDARLACSRVELDFWDVCRGVDAYFEQRRRKLAKNEIVLRDHEEASKNPIPTE